MGSSKKKNRSKPSSDHQQWEITLAALKQVLRKQEYQIETLLQQRNFLQQQFQPLFDRWNFDVLHLQDVISQKQRLLRLSEFVRMFELKKADFLLGSKQRDALVNKLKLEHAQSELDDFKAWFDILSHRCSDKEDISPDRLYERLKTKSGRHSTSKEPNMHHSELEKEVELLKHEYDKLSVKHKSDLSALQDENKFVWNQYKALEGDYTSQLNLKNEEIIKANEKIENLLKSMEQLQSANIEKDERVAQLEAKVNMKEKSAGGTDAVEDKESSLQLEATISTLKDKISELEAQTNQKNGQISALSKELKLLKSTSASETPVLRRCTSRPLSSRLRGKDGKDRDSAGLKEEASSSRVVIEQDGKRSKRKRNDVSIEDTPRLFTSQFKIPKLRSQSPRER